MPRALLFMAWGHQVVGVFIAISGFCLALPLARRGDWSLDSAIFYRRRLRRILPPYFASIAIALLIVLAFTLNGHPQDYIGNPLSWTMVLSHVLMVENWVRSDTFSLNGPLWSVAVECQIYVLFPLLAALWRWGGRWPTLSFAFLVGNAVFFATHHGGMAHFLFLFTEGMLGAELAFTARHKPWLGIAFLVSAVGFLFALRAPWVISDIFVGLSTSLLMAYLTQHPQHWGNRVFGWKPLAWIGTFSYSIYLVHSFFQVLTYRFVFAAGVSPFNRSHSALAMLLVFVVSPVAIAVSYGFHVIFERPFMSHPRQVAEKRFAAEVAS